MRATMATRRTPGTFGRAGGGALKALSGKAFPMIAIFLGARPAEMRRSAAARELQTTASHQRKAVAWARNCAGGIRAPSWRWLPITTGTRANFAAGMSVRLV